MHTSAARSQTKPSAHHPAGRWATATAWSAAAAQSRLYNPRHPERTLLYKTIVDHFEAWLDPASAGQFEGRAIITRQSCCASGVRDLVMALLEPLGGYS